MATQLPLPRRIAYTALVFVVFLLLLEGGLRLVAPATLWLARPSGAGRPIVCLGDSVTAGHGIGRDQAWPAALGRWLEAEGVQGWSVQSRAVGGSKLGDIRQRDQGWVRQQDAPLVLLMAGHNDLMRWGGMADRPGGYDRGAPTAGEAPRLLRISRWIWGIVEDDLPLSDFDPVDVARFGDDVDAIRDSARRAGGELVLLTYVVPGGPPADMDPQQAAVLVAKREHQRQINALIRQVAEAQRVALLDLELGMGAPDTWDPAWFVDSIHLTAGASRQVAEAVGAWLLLSGRLRDQPASAGSANRNTSPPATR